jgi:hypothetical protein
MTATDQWTEDPAIKAALADAYRSDALLDGALLEGVNRVYSTAEAAEFFGRSNQWLYWGMRNNIFVYPPGTPVAVGDAVIRSDTPLRRGDVLEQVNDKVRVMWHQKVAGEVCFEETIEDPALLRVLIPIMRIGGGRRRRFTLSVIRDIALSCYQRGNFKRPELVEVLRRIKEAELGFDAQIPSVDV